MEPDQQITQFLNFLLESFITQDDYQLEVSQAGDIINYSLSVNPDKTGLVIGRQGRTINAIRRLLQVKASQYNLKVFLKVNAPKTQTKDQEDKASIAQSKVEELSQILDLDN